MTGHGFTQVLGAAPIFSGASLVAALLYAVFFRKGGAVAWMYFSLIGVAAVPWIGASIGWILTRTQVSEAGVMRGLWTLALAVQLLCGLAFLGILGLWIHQDHRGP